MAGTHTGGKLAAITNKARHGADFYRRIGVSGGKKGHTGGFRHWKDMGREDLISAAGRKGGQTSRRGKKV